MAWLGVCVLYLACLYPSCCANAGVARLQTQPNIFVQSSDTQTGTTMMSSVIAIKLEEAGNVCRRDMFLILN